MSRQRRAGYKGARPWASLTQRVTDAPTGSVYALLTAVMLSIGLLAGCATGDKDLILPQAGPTMKEVYQRHFSGDDLNASSSSGSEAPSSSAVLKPSIKPYRPTEQDAEFNAQPTTPQTYSDEMKNDLQTVFPRLKNPTLVLYVFAHLSPVEKHPVPGYATAFSFYQSIEFALPGEPEAGY
ncbi:MAG: TIGR03751 family conjugal transfer lipoprotein [Methylomicrobium sp.]|nr:TIGR03751 family conjugal transfer lipoprotein [Methylomicrobium sp.]